MKKIAVIGSLNMDMTVQAPRIPQKGETLIGSDLQTVPGGKGANQAVAAARLGAKVSMYGCVGRDGFGEQLIANLIAQGVDTGGVETVSNVSTGMAFITVAENDNVILVVPGANHCVTPDWLETRRERILQADIILLQNEIPMDAVQAAIEMCAAAGKYVIYNPAPAAPLSAEMSRKVSCLTPNEHEAALLFGDAALDDLLSAQPQKLVVTQGSRGVRAALADGTLLQIPALKVQVVDTTGAGDTFNGALAYAFAAGQDFASALRFAGVSAGLSTTAPGAQGGMPTLAEVLAAIG